MRGPGAFPSVATSARGTDRDHRLPYPPAPRQRNGWHTRLLPPGTALPPLPDDDPAD